MIDPAHEHLITLREAARLLPRRANGKPISMATTYRWTLRGCRGIVLESLQAGGTRITSSEAVARFLLASTPLANAIRPAVLAVKRPLTPTARRAAAELDDAGI